MARPGTRSSTGGFILHGLIQVAVWILLGLVLCAGTLVATYGWLVHIFKYRIARSWFLNRETTRILPDMSTMSREECFNAMAEWNSGFYTKELTTFIPFQRPIRLVYIQPGRFDEPLVCTTVIVDIVKGLEYVALSYAWGQWDEQNPTVTLDGDGGFHITRNAFRALQRVRASGEKRPVWIDAICIDQSNSREKEQQIGLMGAIYQRAQRVYIYLSPCKSHDAGVNNEAVQDCSEHSLLSLKDNCQPWFSDPKSPSLRWWRRAWTVCSCCVKTRAVCV